MDENLIIPENYPELVHMFMGDELYLVEEKKSYKGIKHEGGNTYRFLNLVSHPGDDSIPETGRDFFFRVVNSIKTDKFNMDADGFAFVNIYPYKGIVWENLVKEFSPRYCIFWGTDPQKLGVSCKLYGGTLINGCRILHVESIEEISADNEKKKMLWGLIQRMFDMNK